MLGFAKQENPNNPVVLKDAGFAKVWLSYSAYLNSMREYNDLTILEYYKNRQE